MCFSIIFHFSFLKRLDSGCSLDMIVRIVGMSSGKVFGIFEWLQLNSEQFYLVHLNCSYVEQITWEYIRMVILTVVEWSASLICKIKFVEPTTSSVLDEWQYFVQMIKCRSSAHFLCGFGHNLLLHAMDKMRILGSRILNWLLSFFLSLNICLHPNF